MISILLGFLLPLLLASTSADPSIDVIGGINLTKANYDDAPWIVSLQMYKEDFAYCGATLITAPKDIGSSEGPNRCSAWLATAASCLQGIPQTIATLANIQLKVLDDHEIDLEIQEEITHENYTESTNKYDITILKVHFNMENCNGVPHLDYDPKIAINETLYDYINSTVFGWGLHAENGPLQKELYQVPVALQTDQNCANFYGHEVFDGHSMICAGGTTFGPCSYDTGGPLLCQYNDPKTGNSTKYLCGIASFGDGCGKVPAIFTDVQNVIDWINQVVDDGEDEPNLI